MRAPQSLLAHSAPNTVLKAGSRRDPEKAKSPAAPPKRLAVLQDQFREDLLYWIREDRDVAIRLLRIMDECLSTPFTGIGKPEPLKRWKAWSRRLTEKDRVVYQVADDKIDFLQARFHYE